MKYSKINTILLITGLVLVFSSSKAFCYQEPRRIEHTIDYIVNYDLYFEIDYPDKVTIKYWDKKSIKVIALVDLDDGHGNSKNDSFSLKISSSQGKHKIMAQVDNLEANYVLQKSGTDYKPSGYKSDKILRTGTKIELIVPRNINVEFKTSMGNVAIEHNGGGLLVSTHGSIDLLLPQSTKAYLNLSSLFGEIMVGDKLDIEINNKQDGFKKLSYRSGMDYKLNGGGVQISLVTYGDIKITASTNNK